MHRINHLYICMCEGNYIDELLIGNVNYLELPSVTVAQRSEKFLVKCQACDNILNYCDNVVLLYHSIFN